MQPDRVQVPLLVGMVVRQARDVGHQACVVVVSADVDGPPLGGLTWPGVWVVTAQRPVAGTWVRRWENVVIDFEERRGGEEAGDREPRQPKPDHGGLAAEAESPDKPLDDASRDADAAESGERYRKRKSS